MGRGDARARGWGCVPLLTAGNAPRSRPKFGDDAASAPPYSSFGEPSRGTGDGPIDDDCPETSLSSVYTAGRAIGVSGSPDGEDASSGRARELPRRGGDDASQSPPTINKN